MKRFLLFFFVFVFTGGSLCAQVVDMRAYSRQRGYRSHQNSVSVQSNVVRRNVVPAAVEKNEDASSVEPETAKQDKQDKQDKREKIHQTGLKIFQKKDEKKVMNFNVENPEFRKLNKKQQQDLMNRITFENDESGEL